MREYPLDEFTIQLLEECDDTDAREREDYWIRAVGVVNVKTGIKTVDDERVRSRIYRSKNLEVHRERERISASKNRAKKRDQRATPGT